MLSSLRASSRSSLRPAARSYATPAFSVGEAHGVKFATSDDGAPTAAISVAVLAGSRYASAPGLASVLKASLFKVRPKRPDVADQQGTHKRSAIRLVRETEMYGGVLSSALTREHLVLTAEFMRGDEGFFAEALGDALTQAKFAKHEYNEEVIPSVAAEYEQAIRDPTTYALDLAHQLAFRTGLGASLFASPHTAVDFAAATAYANAAFSSPANFAVVASNVASAQLEALVGEFFVAGAAAPSTSAASTYYGGEVRVPAPGHSHSHSDHFLLAFKGAGLSSVDLVVLRHLLGGETSVKWSKGNSPLSLLSTSNHVSAHAFNLSYSDAGLFGFLLKAPTAGMEGLAKQAVAELKKVAAGANAEEVKKAIAKAKFAAAAEYESRVGRLEILGASIANTGSAHTLEQVFAQFDAVTPASVTKAAAEALASRPTTVAIGDTHHLPYADSIF